MLIFNWYATFKTKKKSFAFQFLCEDQATYRNCFSPNAQPEYEPLTPITTSTLKHMHT